MANFGLNNNSSNTYQLLTPNAFEMPKPPDVSKQLSDALDKIAKLQQENESLQKQNKIQVEKRNNVSSIQQANHDSVQTGAHLSFEPYGRQVFSHAQPQLSIESLFTRQAAEIAELRQKMCQLTADHGTELTLLEDRHQQEKQRLLDEHWSEVSDLKYSQHEEKNKLEQEAFLTNQQNERLILNLESELKQKSNYYETQVANLSEDYQSEMEILHKEKDDLKKDLNENRMKGEILQQNLDDLKTNSESQILQLQQELHLKTVECENQLKQITQLKMYIGQSENIPKSAEILKTENDTLRNKLNVCTVEKDHVQSNLEFLNIRLSSMAEILSLQEAELSQDSFGERKKEKENALLKRWREKVFSLLVQQKSTIVVLKSDENDWKNKMSSMQSQLLSAKNQIQILGHSLSDKQAQLDISNNNNNRLENELLVTKKQLDSCSNQATKDQGMVLGLKNFTLSISSKLQEQCHHFETVNKQLASFEQRINFAASRVLLLQNIIARQKYMSKVHQKQQQQTEIVIKDKTEESSSQSLDDQVPVYAKTELARLQAERDILAAQLTEMTQSVEERIKMTETKYQEQEIYLKKELEEAHNSLKAASDKCQSVTLQLEKMQAKYEEKDEEVESLKINLAEEKVTAKQTLDQLEQTHNEALAMQFAEMDEKVNDMQRQHLKAEISLRHTERQQERQQTCHAEQQKTMEQDFQWQLMEIRNQLRLVESERNLMMATLRQEGLMGKLKFDPPSTLQDPMSIVDRTPAAAVPEVSSCNQEDEDTPIDVLLKDMKQISTAILEDSSDESLS